MTTAVPVFVIRQGGLNDPRVARFLGEHLQDMRRTSPPESVHALDLDALSRPEVTFWTLWLGEGPGATLAGTGALKQLAPDHAELKSMRVHGALRGQGLAKRLLEHIVEHARNAGIRRLSLETGSQPFFEPARTLYQRQGFEPCPPFGDYRDDPNSQFFTRSL